MILSFLKRPNTRLLLALISFFGSTLILGFMFRDSFPDIAPALTAEQREVKAKEKAKAKALETWKAYNATHRHDLVEQDPPPEQPPWGDVVIAGQETTDLSWSDRLTER